MDTYQMSSAEIARTKMQVNEANKKIGINREGEKNSLGKDSFLKLLVTELKHQDPTKPMEDREFISQMAQFSSLEQMTNMNKEFKTLLKSSQSAEAYRLLGKHVEAFDQAKQKRVSGIVSSITYNQGAVNIRVGNEEVSLNDIHTVRDVQDSNNNNSK